MHKGPALPRPRVFLVGPPGAGKSGIGERLARRLDQPFADADREIELRAGCSIRELFRQKGEPAFRQLERDTIMDLAVRESIVLSTGGGAVLDAGTRSVLGQHGRVVYLYADTDTLLKRTARDQSRPLLAGAERGFFLDMLRERGPLYRELAGLSVDTGTCAPEEAVGRIAGWLEGMRRG